MITTLMTETVTIKRAGTKVSDGLGGYTTTLQTITTALAKIDQRKSRERFSNEQLDKEVTNKIYLKYPVLVQDRIVADSNTYIVLDVSFFRDLAGGDSYYSALCKVG